MPHGTELRPETVELFEVALGQLAETVDSERASAADYPLVDDDRRCGRHRARTDLLGPDADPDTPLSSIASTDVVTLTPEDTLVTALERIVDEEVEHLPVLDDDRRIVGMCTRTDILRARSRHLTAEQSQQGWHAAWRRRRAAKNGSD